MVGQLWNVILSLPKWGQVDLYGIDSVEKILSESIVSNHVVHGHIRRADQSDIYWYGLVGSNAGHFSLLEHREQFGL
jgi:hypothetical protein